MRGDLVEIYKILMGPDRVDERITFLKLGKSRTRGLKNKGSSDLESGIKGLMMTMNPLLMEKPVWFTNKFGWKGELRSGIYHLLPFTTGCRLRKRRKSKTREAKLVHREDGNLALTKEFRAALSDIFEIIDLDGNGLLSFDEYNFFELRTSGEKCDREAWIVCQ
eukprot:g38692.t1